MQRPIMLTMAIIGPFHSQGVGPIITSRNVMGPSATFINRTQELQRLAEISSRPGAKIVVVYGRRRVGKTALLEHVFKKRGLVKFALTNLARHMPSACGVGCDISFAIAARNRTFEPSSKSRRQRQSAIDLLFVATNSNRLADYGHS